MPGIDDKRVPGYVIRRSLSRKSGIPGGLPPRRELLSGTVGPLEAHGFAGRDLHRLGGRIDHSLPGLGSVAKWRSVPASVQKSRRLGKGRGNRPDQESSPLRATNRVVCALCSSGCMRSPVILLLLKIGPSVPTENSIHVGIRELATVAE